jgi:hypothetical protein
MFSALVLYGQPNSKNPGRQLPGRPGFEERSKVNERRGASTVHTMRL